MTKQTAPAGGPRPLDAKPVESWYTAVFETEDITIPPHTITIVRELSARAGMVAMAPWYANDDPETSLFRMRETNLMKLASYLRSWSLPVKLDPDPDKDGTVPDAIQFRAGVLRRMRAGIFDQLYAEIEKREAAQIKNTPIIEPEISLEADAWFTTDDDTKTLQLPGGHWMRIRSELTHGEILQLSAPPAKDDPLKLPPYWQAIRKVGKYLKAWSMVYPDGRPVDPDMEAVAELPTSKFGVIARTLNAYEERLRKVRSEDPTGADGSSRPSASPKG